VTETSPLVEIALRALAQELGWLLGVMPRLSPEPDTADRHC
jgi:hypothetical protein